MLPRCVTLLAVLTLAPLSAAAPLADQRKAPLTYLDGRATTPTVTSRPAPTEPRDTSDWPDADNSREQAQAQPNDEDLNRAEREGASDATDSDGVAQDPDEPQAENEESPESADRIKSPKSSETADMLESAESSESAESVESTASPEYAEPEESPDSIRSGESSESPESADPQESAESPKSAESVESTASPEYAESEESPDSTRSGESSESPTSLHLSRSQSESSSEAGKESEKTTGECESDVTEACGGNGADPVAAFNSEEGGKLGPGVFDEEDARSKEGSERSERHEMEGEQIREEDGNDEGSRASVSVEDAELGVKEEENVQETEESSQVFDSTEATLVEKSDSTPSRLRE